MTNKQMQIAPAAFTVDEFCSTYRVSRTTLHRLMVSGNGPNTFRIGRRRLITREAADTWVKAQEARASA
jgi:excisionase family DNA binding protein